MLKFLRIDASVTWHHHLIVLLWTNFFPAGNCLLKVNNVNFEHVVASWVEIITTYKILFLIQALTYSKSLTSCCTLVSCTWWKQVRFNIHIRKNGLYWSKFYKFLCEQHNDVGWCHCVPLFNVWNTVFRKILRIYWMNDPFG